jgi:tRNA modification GTPase
MASGASGPTIFALSSGSQPAAIGVIRISGPRAGDCLTILAGAMPAARRATLRRLRDPRNSDVLDSALLLWFPGPHTATGEDLAELHLHGGRAVIDAVLDALGRIDGVRQAQAGEFTRRAFANGAIDLLEAEGLADLLSAETETQRRSAIGLAGGTLSRRILGWQGTLLGESAMLEALIEYDEEDDVRVDPGASARRIRALADEIESVLGLPPAERLRDGIQVAIAGPPNAGKSTLLNAIAGRDVAITSPIAGTTRDIIEASVAIEGVPFVFRDTAGLRDTAGDRIEEIGISRAEAAVAAADVVLWLGDPCAAPERANLIAVHARSDQPGREDVPQGSVAVSAHTLAGMKTLMARVVEVAAGLLPQPGDVALNRRQRGLLAECLSELQAAQAQRETILAAEHLRLARAAIDRLTGAAGTEDMLDALFGRFCIGK